MTSKQFFKAHYLAYKQRTSETRNSIAKRLGVSPNWLSMLIAETETRARSNLSNYRCLALAVEVDPIDLLVHVLDDEQPDAAADLAMMIAESPVHPEEMELTHAVRAALADIGAPGRWELLPEDLARLSLQVAQAIMGARAAEMAS